MTSTKRFPDLLLGRGPTISRAILEKGSSITGRGISGAGATRFEEAFWQLGQFLQYSATSLLTPGQKNLWRTRSVVFFLPKCPAMGIACAICNTGSLHAFGNTSCSTVSSLSFRFRYSVPSRWKNSGSCPKAVSAVASRTSFRLSS